MVKPEFRVYSFPPCETIRFKIPLSKVSCVNCAKKNSDCICETIEENIGKYEGYSISELNSLKSQLDSVRSELDHIDIGIWQSFTSLNNIAQDVIYKLREVPVELPTTGWCKLYEILHYFRWHEFIVGDEYHSMHLCECPGGFISALNHYISSNVTNKRQRQGSSKIHWEWRANSLNPYYEFNNPNTVLTDDVIYRDTYRAWNMGIDDSGDITNTSNIDYIWEKTSKSIKNCWLADLVTADGSKDIQYNPNEQETITSLIQYSEVVCALGLLRMHGSFILKCFNIFNHTTISVIALLCYCFQNLHIVKPIMSKGGNGEVYIVALNFQGIRSVLLKNLLSHFQEKKSDFHNYSLFPREWLPDEFIDQCVTAATLFCRWQIENISHNLMKFKTFMIDSKFTKNSKIRTEDIDSATDCKSDELDTGENFECHNERLSLDCLVTKREKRLFALEYIQKLGITSISTSHFLLPSRRLRKEYSNSTSLSRKGGERVRTQGIYIDRKYAFQQYQKLQEARTKLYHPVVSFLKFKLEGNKLDKDKLIYLIDNHSDKIESEISVSACTQIPLKKTNPEIHRVLPNDKFPKKISGKWFSLSRNDADFQRLFDRLKSQAYMFEPEHFFKKVPRFPCERLQMSPYCNEELIRRYCESIVEIKSPIRGLTFGVDTCICNEIYNNNFRWTKIPFDLLKQRISTGNKSKLKQNVSSMELDSNIEIEGNILIDDLSLFCQIPANKNILSLFEALRELKNSNLEYRQISISQYLGRINNFVEIYNGLAYLESLERFSKFPLSYILNINTNILNRGVVILNDNEFPENFKKTYLNNKCSSGSKLIDISDEFKHCTHYKQVINAITEENNIKKNDFDLIYIDPYSHLLQTYSLGQLEIEESFNFLTDIMIALNLIKLGGNIIISLKTALTRFTAGIIVVLSSVFDKIGLFRPFSSSSPYYSSFHLICSGYNDAAHTISRHFFQYLWDFSFMAYKEKNLVIQCVPPTIFASDTFLHWMKDFNNETISYDIDLLEKVIENQQNTEESGMNYSNSVKAEETSNILWDSYKNRAVVQREILSFILLGTNFDEELDGTQCDANIPLGGKISDEVYDKGDYATSKEENETNYFLGDSSDQDSTRKDNYINELELSGDNPDKLNIDPFEDTHCKNSSIDVFKDMTTNEFSDPFL